MFLVMVIVNFSRFDVFLFKEVVKKLYFKDYVFFNLEFLEKEFY